MKLTNNLGLPEAIVRAVSNDDYDRGKSDFTVTELISPPQLVALRRLHSDEIIEDVSDRIWILLGKSIHAILESAGDNELKEERLYTTINGVCVGGQFDRLALRHSHYGAKLVLSDYKLTSAWSVIGKVKADWVNQLNLLAHLVREEGLAVGHLEIVAILRDWSRSSAQKSDDYPERNVVVVPVPLWGNEKCEAYLQERVSLHVTAREGVYPECTPEERWERPSVWAIKKAGRKSAIKGGLHDTQESAEKHLAELGAGHSIEYRQGRSVRCSDGHCPVKNWCKQYAAMTPVVEEEAVCQ